MRSSAKMVFAVLAGQLLCAQENVWNGSDSVLKNPSFEMSSAERPGEPESWNAFTESGEVGLTRISINAAQHGQQSVNLAFDTRRDKFVGLAQEVGVAPGEKWKLSGFFRNVGLKGTSHAKLGIEWKNGENRELLRSTSAKIDRSNTSDKEWTKFSVEGLAPPATTHATVTVTLYIADAEEGSLLVDTVWMEKVQ